MPASPSQLIEQTTRHSVFLERVKTSEQNKFEPFLRRMDAEVRQRLSGANLTEFTRGRLERLAASTRAALESIQGEYNSQLLSNALELGQEEAAFEVRSLSEVVDYDFAIPPPPQVVSAIITRPLSITGPDGGKLLEPFIRDMSTREIAKVEGAIRAGYFQGQTTNQILQRVRGTRAAGFNDGILQGINRTADVITRTGLQHAASQARQATWETNSDIVKGVLWSSTLDSRTSTQCRSLDGQRFPIDSGPRPPIHPNCRSSVTAALDERFNFLQQGGTRFSRGPDGVDFVPAKQSYYEWLKRQPKGFQDAAIGPKRAKLLRDGKISAQRFAELQLGKNFEPLTLKEMRELDPLVFERAGVEV